MAGPNEFTLLCHTTTNISESKKVYKEINAFPGWHHGGVAQNPHKLHSSVMQHLDAATLPLATGAFTNRSPTPTRAAKNAHTCVYLAPIVLISM